jgi:RecB family exonuclease
MPPPSRPVEFITGPLAALEDAFADAVREARAGDPLARLTVVVGHVLLKRYLPRMLAGRGIAHMNMRFLRPLDLALELADGQLASHTRMTPAVNLQLVRQIAAAASGDYFGGIARGEGFVDALRRLFADLEGGGFDDAASLEAALLGSDAAGNRQKLRELASMYGSYLEARKAAGLAGTSDAYAAADPGLLEGDLLIYGLWDPSELQMRLIERVAEGRGVRVFTVVAAAGDDDPLEKLRARMAGAVRRVDAPAAGPIAAVAAQLFADAAAAPIETDRVKLMSAPDTVREVWEAARACQRWAREGIAFHEMAVAYRNREPYRALIDEIFREAGVEAYVHDGRPLAEHPLGRRLMALLDLAASAEFSRQQVMEFIAETELPYATRTDARYGRISPALWDAYTRDAGVVAGIAQWRERLTRVAGERKAEATAEGNEWKAEAARRIDEMLLFMEEFHDALAGRPEEATWAEHLAYAGELASRYAAGLEPILDALEDLRGLETVAPRVRFDDFCRAVRDDLESRDQSSVMGEPQRLFGRQGVAVLDATSLRHLRFRAVCLLGVAERAWPPPPRPDPLLLEHERAALNAAASGNAAAGLAPAIALRTTPERDAPTFRLALQAAREHVSVSVARADAGSSGKHVASYFFRAVAEALVGRTLSMADLDVSDRVRRLSAGRLACEDPADALTAAEYDRGLVRDEIEGRAPAASAALTIESPSFGRAIDARQQRWGRAYTAWDGVMTAGDAVARAAALQFGRERPVSPSRLEMYAECPYRYFMRYALRVDPIEEPETLDRINALERGSMIHAILEAFLTRIGRDDPPRASERLRHIELLLEVAREEGARREAAGATGRPLLWRIDQRNIHHDLIRWYDAEVSDGNESHMLPGAFEVGFGGVRAGYGEAESPYSTDEPLVLEVGGRQLRLQGRIDRLDWDEGRTRFRVIDYKTGKKKEKRTFGGGQYMQLPVYLHAAAGILGLPPTAGEAQYFYVSAKGEFSRVPIDGWRLSAVDGEFRQILTTIADGIDRGYFAPNPGPKKEHCRFCDYKDVCDRDIDRAMSGKTGDARADAYARMREIE